MKRMASLLLSMLLLLSLASSALAVTGINPEPNTLPITTENITLTVFSDFNAAKAAYMNTINDHPVVLEYERLTGINLEFIHPPQGDDGTFFTTMIASGEYPDLMYNKQTGRFRDYPGGIDGAIEDGILMDISDIVKQYASNFWQRIDEKGGDSQMRKVLSDEGRIIGLGSLFRPPALDGKFSYGMVFRKDYLDQAGITELPRTVDELTETLRAIKALGVEVPLMIRELNYASYSKSNFLASAYGVTNRDFFVTDGGVVKHGFLEPAYKDYLETMRLWMEEGLISRDFITKHDIKAMLLSGEGAAGFVHNADTITMHGMGDEGFVLVAIQYPRLLDPDEHLGFGNNGEAFSNEAWVVSATCEHPVEAVRFIDFLYSDEAILLSAWGTGEVDGNQTFVEEADGTRTFTEYANDPDISTFRARWTLGDLAVYYEQQMEFAQYNTPSCLDNWDKWTFNYDKSNQLPMHMTPTADESRDIAAIMNRVYTYADEAVLKFILGEMSMDQYDAFVEQCKSLGLEDAVKLNQQAYDRYMAR